MASYASGAEPDQPPEVLVMGLVRFLANEMRGRDTTVNAFLVGPDGGWVNAQVLRANGGYV